MLPEWLRLAAEEKALNDKQQVLNKRTFLTHFSLSGANTEEECLAVQWSNNAEGILSEVGVSCDGCSRSDGEEQI